MSDENTAALDLAAAFRRLVETREKRDQTKLAAENAEKEYRQYEAELFEEITEGPIKGTIRFDLGEPIGVVTFTPRETTYGRIIDTDAALAYFEEHEEVEQMSSRKIEKGRLNAVVRERLEQGKSMPSGIDWYANRGITISRKS